MSGVLVLCASQHVGNEPFAVLLGDDLIDEAETLLTTKMKVQKTGGSVIALIEVDPSEIRAYGCRTSLPLTARSLSASNSMVKKPAVGEAPSNLAVIGRYVLHPSVFGVLENTEPGRGG